MRHLRLVLVLCASVISMCALHSGCGGGGTPRRLSASSSRIRRPGTSIPRPPTTLPRGGSSTPRARNWSTSRTPREPPAWRSRLMRRLCRRSRTAGSPTPSQIRAGSASSSGEAVTPDSFRVAIERTLKLDTAPGLPPVADYLSAVRGVSAYVAGASSISGLSVSGNQLIFTLTHPTARSRSSTSRSSAPSPTGTPSVHQTSPLPSAAIHYISPLPPPPAPACRLYRSPRTAAVSRPSVLPEMIDVTVGGDQTSAIAGGDSNNPATMDCVAGVR